MTNTINDLLAKLNTQTAQLRNVHNTRQEATVNTDTIELRERFANSETIREGAINELVADMDEHDWDSYDSSDIHLRMQEWEAQARPTVIQHFVPKKQPITATQREHANAALMKTMPGVQIGANLRQHTAYKLLVEFLGLDAANTIMGGK